MRTRWVRVTLRSTMLVAMAALIVTFLVGPLPVRAISPASTSFSFPAQPFYALRLFDRPDTPWGAGHRGIDLKVTIGQEALSPGDGVVAFAGYVVDRGVVSIRHTGGLMSSLEPISPTVEVGTAVSSGEPIGTVTDEHGHCAPRTCLHWGVRQDGNYINPLDVLVGFGPVRLLPLDG